MKAKQDLQEDWKFPIKIFWFIRLRNIERRSFLISKQFGLWKPEPKKTEISNKIISNLDFDLPC